MATNMTGLNIATRIGDGAADVLSFNNLDAVAKRLYAEQKQKELQGQKEYDLAQQELSKDFSKVRSADYKDLMSKFQGVKSARQKLLFDQKIKDNPLAYAEQRRLADVAERDFRAEMQKSIELKDLDKQVTQRLMTNRDEFDDDKVPAFQSALNMPTSEREKLGLIGAEPFRYTGIDLKGLGDAARRAMGSSVKVPYGERTIVDGGYNYLQPYIGRTNDPLQYASNMLKEMQQKKFAQGARAMYSSMSPNEAKSIQDNFNKIPDAEFEQKWGISKDKLINQFPNTDDKVSQYVLFDAMKYAYDNLPKEVESKKEKNIEFDKEQDYQTWLRKNKITDSQATKRAYISRAANGNANQPVFYYDSFGEIKDKGKKSSNGALAINELSATTQENILNIAKKSLGRNDVDNSEITVNVDPASGEVTLHEAVKEKRGDRMVNVVGKQISKLTELDLNYSNAPTVKEKREISQKEQANKANQKIETKKETKKTTQGKVR